MLFEIEKNAKHSLWERISYKDETIASCFKNIIHDLFNQFLFVCPSYAIQVYFAVAFFRNTFFISDLTNALFQQIWKKWLMTCVYKLLTIHSTKWGDLSEGEECHKISEIPN